MKLTEDNIEDFIRKNRNEFNWVHPDDRHEERFFHKLSRKFKKFISIVPYLFRVLIVTIIIFIVSVIVWDNYIRKDRNEVTLKGKIINIIDLKK